jgi:hypothetical protein
VSRCGTGRTEELNEIVANVSLMSFLRSSNGVSSLIIMIHEKDGWRKKSKLVTHRDSIVCFKSSKVGSVLLRSVKVCSNEAGRVTFERASRFGTEIWGAVIAPKGLTALIASMAVLMAELALEMSF